MSGFQHLVEITEENHKICLNKTKKDAPVNNMKPHLCSPSVRGLGGPDETLNTEPDFFASGYMKEGEVDASHAGRTGKESRDGHFKHEHSSFIFVFQYLTPLHHFLLS